MRKLASLVLAGGLPALSLGVGLGEVQLHSALNQPLNAEAEVFSIGNISIDDIKINLATADVFDDVGIDRPYYLTKINYKVVKKTNGKVIVKMTTDGPVSEPYLDFLVSVNWSHGQVLRNYTLLLDPPSNKVKPIQRVIRQASQYGNKTISASEYGPVHVNDTLWGIATQLPQRQHASLNQVMVALVNKNPQAFIGGNMNQLRAGVRLKLPTQADVDANPKQRANKIVRAHGEAWRLQQPLETVMAKTEVVQKPEVTPQAKVSQKPKFVQKSEFAQMPDDVTVFMDGTTTEPQAVTPMPLPPRTTVSKTDTPRVILNADASVENSAWMQDDKTNKRPKTDGSLRAQMAIYAQDLKNARETNTNLRLQMQSLEEKDQRKDTELRQLEVQLKQLESQLQGVIGQPQANQVGNTQATVAPEVEFGRTTTDKESESSWLTWLLGSLTLAGFVGAGAWFTRRYQTNKPGFADDVVPTMVTDEEDDDDIVEFDATTNKGVLEKTDPLEEAGVFLAYKRYADAERVLKTALTTDMSNLAFHLKLLEVYAAQNDKQKFEMHVTVLPMDQLHTDDDASQQVETLRQSMTVDDVVETSQATPETTAEQDEHVLEFESTDKTEQSNANSNSQIDALAGDDVIATMLDLAMVYIDMGDDKGAKEILQKVMNDGNEKQRQEAQKLLDKL